MYVNDVTRVTSVSMVIMYADNCTCIITAGNREAANAMANEELRRLAEWFCVNKLSLNNGKTKGIFSEKLLPLSHKANGLLMTDP